NAAAASTRGRSAGGCTGYGNQADYQPSRHCTASGVHTSPISSSSDTRHDSSPGNSATPMPEPQRSTRQSQTISKPKRFRPPSVGSTATRKGTNELSKQSSPNTWQAGVPHLESTSGHGLRRYVQKGLMQG